MPAGLETVKVYKNILKILFFSVRVKPFLVEFAGSGCIYEKIGLSMKKKEKMLKMDQILGFFARLDWNLDVKLNVMCLEQYFLSSLKV